MTAEDFADKLIANARLTRRQADILTKMRDAPEGSDESELVYGGGRAAWLGLSRVATRTIYTFLGMCAISADGFSSGGVERYHINATGRAILARHEERGRDAR